MRHGEVNETGAQVCQIRRTDGDVVCEILEGELEGSGAYLNIIREGWLPSYHDLRIIATTSNMYIQEALLRQAKDI